MTLLNILRDAREQMTKAGLSSWQVAELLTKHYVSISVSDEDSGKKLAEKLTAIGINASCHCYGGNHGWPDSYSVAVYI